MNNWQKWLDIVSKVKNKTDLNQLINREMIEKVADYIRLLENKVRFMSKIVYNLKRRGLKIVKK